jgi:hypothetical protein
MVMHQRPAHAFADNDSNAAYTGDVVANGSEHAAIALEDHRRMNHDAVYSARAQCPLQMIDRPAPGSRRLQRRVFGGRPLAGRAYSRQPPYR